MQTCVFLHVRIHPPPANCLQHLHDLLTALKFTKFYKMQKVHRGLRTNIGFAIFLTVVQF